MDNYNYPPGADTPDAPWNQDDRSEEIAEKQWEMYCDRLDDEPDAWIAEGVTESGSGRGVELFFKVVDNLKSRDQNGEIDRKLGQYIRELVTSYATPSEDEALEELNREGDDYE